MKCTYFPACQGCIHWDLSYPDQAALKIKNLEELFARAPVKIPKIDFISCGDHGLRHRIDFTIQNLAEQQMGFYDQERNLIDIETCLQLSPELQQFFSDFRKISFPIKKGSVRLRVGPGGQRGCWFDFSNLDIKNLLSEKSLLQSLLDQGVFVEVGQKGKKLQNINGALKLTEPEANEWFETYDSQRKPLKLKGLVSDFTQPSRFSAKKMVEIVLAWVQPTEKLMNLIEFGPGLGQFTLPLLSCGYHVSVFENDASATANVKRNAESNQLDRNLEIHLGDYQNKTLPLTHQIDLALVNPPRSGLKQFTQELIRTQAKKCIYISCFPESMVNDVQQLVSAGYRITAVKIVDQFPQTKHYETCIQLEKLF